MQSYDLVCIGGGLAGLTLALQVKQQRPQTRVAVIDRRQFPLEEIVGKLGESCVELAAHYFDSVLGLKEHLDNEQLPKLGLRYFLEHGSERELHERLEIGNNAFAPTPSYQLDRSRLENHLRELVVEAGVTFFSDSQVKDVTLSENAHQLRVRTPEGSQVLESRWLVDASGRAGLLRKQLDLNERLSHSGTAAWWRFEGEFRVDDWCEDPAWGAKNQGDVARWFSTNHLMGEGYWVWIIPLSSKATSFGIVADPEIHPFTEFHTFEKATEWLHKHERQLGALIEANKHCLKDFGAMKNYSHSCKEVFSAKRWALTGEAGLFIDPFYSPGSDFIALANTYIADLVLRDLDGEGISLRASVYNDLYLKFAHSTTSTFEGQYEIIGNPLVMPIKVFWDWCFYWRFLSRLFFEGKICDLRFISNERARFERFGELGDTMQALFKRWNALQRPRSKAGFLDLGEHPYLFELNRSLLQRSEGDSFPERFAEDLEALEQLAREISELFTRCTGESHDAIERRKPDDSDSIQPFFNDLLTLLEFHEGGVGAQDSVKHANSAGTSM